MMRDNKRKIMLVDVDLTVVDPSKEWVEYMNKISGYNITLENQERYPYDLSKLYPQWVDRDALFSFWNKQDLYDDMNPIENSVEVLKEMNKAGFNIVFASVIKHGHDKSKYYFLKRNFPFMAGCVYTREKGFIKADVFIDDRHSYLNQMNDSVLKIKRNTQFEQTEDLTVKAYTFDDWLEVEQGMSDLMKAGLFV